MEVFYYKTQNNYKKAKMFDCRWIWSTLTLGKAVMWRQDRKNTHSQRTDLDTMQCTRTCSMAQGREARQLGYKHLLFFQEIQMMSTCKIPDLCLNQRMKFWERTETLFQQIYSEWIQLKEVNRPMWKIFLSLALIGSR